MARPPLLSLSGPSAVFCGDLQLPSDARYGALNFACSRPAARPRLRSATTILCATSTCICSACCNQDVSPYVPDRLKQESMQRSSHITRPGDRPRVAGPAVIPFLRLWLSTIFSRRGYMGNRCARATRGHTGRALTASRRGLADCCWSFSPSLFEPD